MKMTLDLNEKEIREALLEWARKHHGIENTSTSKVLVSMPEMWCQELKQESRRISILVEPIGSLPCPAGR